MEYFKPDPLLFYAMVLNRISDPLSKRGVNEWLKEVYRPSLEHLKLHHLYRSLDFLADNKESIEIELFDRTRTLFDFEVDMVFWDTTSTYFEGNGPSELDFPKTIVQIGCRL